MYKAIIEHPPLQDMRLRSACTDSSSSPTRLSLSMNSIGDGGGGIDNDEYDDDDDDDDDDVEEEEKGGQKESKE